MAYNTYYTISCTTLEGNTLVYNLEQDAASTTAGDLNITENSYELEYFFNDLNSQKIGLGFISKILTLEFVEDTEINAILVNPEGWRLTVTLDGSTLFVGFPDIRSISECALPSHSNLYTCTFISIYSRLKSEYVITAIASSANAEHASDEVPIPDLVGEFIYEEFCDLTSEVFIAHDWQSDNTRGSTTRLAAPHMRYWKVDPGRTTPESIAEFLAYVNIAFFMRVGYSHIEDKILMIEHTKGADGSSISGYDCPKVGSGFRTASAATVALQSLASDGSDFIEDGKDINSDNPPFPAAIIATDGNGQYLESTSINSMFVENPVELTTTLLNNALCTANEDGILTENNSVPDTLGVVDFVDPSSTSTTYELREAIGKRLGADYLFTEGLKGFRVPVNKVLDPMIPITYNSKVYITSTGVINLYEEVTDCLLVEIQDNG